MGLGQNSAINLKTIRLFLGFGVNKIKQQIVRVIEIRLKNQNRSQAEEQKMKFMETHLWKNISQGLSILVALMKH